MLGREIRDPLGIESAAGDCRGLGLLDASTVMAAEKTLVRTSARHAPSGLDVAGYEIHHGQTVDGHVLAAADEHDGQVVGIAAEDGRIWGTYLHGVFDADAFRRWFVDRLRVRRGLPPLGQPGGHYDIEPALDRLADVVRSQPAHRRDLPADGTAMRLEYQVLIAVALDLALGRSPLAAAPGPRHRPAGRDGAETLARRLLGRRASPDAWQRWPSYADGRAGSLGGDLLGRPLASTGRRCWWPSCLIYTTIAARDLAGTAWPCFAALAAGDLAEARRRVRPIVGRDTERLDAAGRGPGGRGKRGREHRGRRDRAAVLRGRCRAGRGDGLPGDQHAGFDVRPSGRALSPASAGRPRGSTTWPTTCRRGSPRPLVCLAALLLRQRPLGALRILLRDGRNHASPNAGLAEAAMAGALGVQLGGLQLLRRPAAGETDHRRSLDALAAAAHSPGQRHDA